MKSKKSSDLLRNILLILAAMAIGGGAYWYFLGKTALSQSSSQAGTGAARSTATVQRGDVALTASGSGTLVSNAVVNMSFSTSGRVAELKVKLGDMVKKGDVLARLENASDLEANLATAQANLLQAQQTLTTLQKGAGSSLAQAYQALVTARATYNDALAASQLTTAGRCSPELTTRYKNALEQALSKLNLWLEADPNSDGRVIAGYDYDTALANYNYCASYTPAEKNEAQSNLEVAKEALKEAEDRYNTLKDASGIDPDTLSMDETKVETAQTAVTNAQDALDGTTMIASIDGKITSLAAAVGAIVDTSTFLTISDVSHPAVTVTLDSTDLDKLVVGNTATVTFTALPGKTFTGKVSLANPTMNSFGPFKAATGQVTLDAGAVQTMAAMPLGISATIKITGQEAKNVLVLPVSALTLQMNGDYVVKRVGSDGKVTQQTVTVGIQDATKAEITSGLQEGDIVSITTSNSSSSSNNGGMFLDGGRPPD